MASSSLENRIFEGFVHEFNRLGPAFTLNDIAHYLHMAKKTIYTVFDSKSDIYERLLQRSMKEILAAQKAVFEDNSLSTHDKLFKILTIKTTNETLLDVGKFSVIHEYEPAFFEHLMKGYELQWDYFARLVEIGKKDGTLRPNTNAAFLINVLTSAYQGFYRDNFLLESHLTYSDAVAALAKTILSGAYLN
jgi:AcrR family transcriptional regulator